MSIFKPNLDRVLQSINKIVDDLEQIQDYHANESIELVHRITELEYQHADAIDNHARATRVADKLRDLLS